MTLLLVIVTPGFFRSPACRAEVERFLTRERDLGRDDLILPVYYVSTPELEDPARRVADPLARVIASRQYADWRELRFEPFTSPVVRRAIAQLAARMCDTFWRPASRGTFWHLPAEEAADRRKPGPVAGPQPERAGRAISAEATVKTERSTPIMAPYNREDFARANVTIDGASAPLGAEAPGARPRPALGQKALHKKFSRCS